MVGWINYFFLGKALEREGDSGKSLFCCFWVPGDGLEVVVEGVGFRGDGGTAAALAASGEDGDGESGMQT